MLPKKYSTEDVSPLDAFAYWRETVCGVFINLECETPDRRAFSGAIHTQALAEIEVSNMQARGMSLTRTPRHIARAKDDHFLVVLQAAGVMHAQQDDQQATLQAGDCALFDSARPYMAQLSDSFNHTVIKVPRGLMRARYGPVEAASGTRIPGDRGLGFLLSRFLSTLPGSLPTLDGPSAARVGHIALDLVAAAIAELKPPSLASDGATRVARRLQIKGYIEAHLCDPNLSLERIAADLKVSTRYLNDLFEQEGISVARHIWSRRLEECRAQLTDPLHAGRSISSIAFGLGYNSMAHFSRSFRARFGVAPRELRSEVRSSAEVLS